MSAFVDATLFRFTQDAFIVDMLTNGIGISAVFNATFTLKDVELDAIAVSSIGSRSYKVPVFETIRTAGTEEQIMPSQQRIRTQRLAPRSGRLDWVDVKFQATVKTTMKTLVAPLESVTTQGLEDRLGGVSSLAELRTKLEAVYAPSMVDDLFVRLKITTLKDFQRRIHLFVELVGGAPPPFDPADPANTRSFDMSVCVRISETFDVAGALQSAKLCRDILEHEAVPDELDGLERTTPYAFVTVFPDGAVTDSSIPGHTAAEAKAAAGDLFTTERMFAHFVH